VTRSLVGGVSIDERGDPSSPGVLLWPGLGATGGYFSLVAERLAPRTVAADPPGTGSSPAIENCTFEQMVSAAVGLIGALGCQAMVGHSLGADLAVGVATDPPPGLGAVVLVDGGYVDAKTRGELGMPSVAERETVAQFVQQNATSFADWETAYRELAEVLGTDVTAAVEAFVRDEYEEVDSEIRSAVREEILVDHLVATWRVNIAERAAKIAVPTLLIACGEPAELATIKRSAWERFAAASRLVDVYVAEGWGHNPFVQDPESSSQLVADWLRARV
jgi:pimeloyl-ACP methyl ester carboxylesterase